MPFRHLQWNISLSIPLNASYLYRLNVSTPTHLLYNPHTLLVSVSKSSDTLHTCATPKIYILTCYVIAHWECEPILKYKIFYFLRKTLLWKLSPIVEFTVFPTANKNASIVIAPYLGSITRTFIITTLRRIASPLWNLTHWIIHIYL